MVLGLEPYVAAVIIAFIGVAATNVVGWLKSDGAFNPRKVAASVIISIPASLLFVATELSVIQIPDGNGLAGLIVFTGLVAQVAGFDTLVKNAKTIIKND